MLIEAANSTPVKLPEIDKTQKLYPNSRKELCYMYLSLLNAMKASVAVFSVAPLTFVSQSRLVIRYKLWKCFPVCDEHSPRATKLGMVSWKQKKQSQTESL